MLLATAACNFATSQLQEVVRTRQFFDILTCKCALCNFSTSQRQKMVRTLNFVFNILTCKYASRASRYSCLPFFHIMTSKSATVACNFSTSQLQKMVRTRQFFNILTCKCASRYSGVQFFHIPASKNGPNPSVFQHFDLQMCFSLQRRAIFPHPSFKKWSDPVSFLQF